MVIENIINVKKAKREPHELFLIGFFYSSLALMISNWIFRDQASMLMVFLTSFGVMPFVYNLIKEEEQIDVTESCEKTKLGEHYKAIRALSYLFLGILFSFTLWYIVLPINTAKSMFQTQTGTILEINNKISANYINSFYIFSEILINNLKVLLVSIIFSFIYGYGAIFIITWNASVLGTAMGILIKNRLIENTPLISAVGMGMGRYLIHGVPEILAYFIGGLAGGIISVSVINHDIRTKKFWKIVLDSVDLIVISIVVLIIAAYLESYLVPGLFQNF